MAARSADAQTNPAVTVLGVGSITDTSRLAMTDFYLPAAACEENWSVSLRLVSTPDTAGSSNYDFWLGSECNTTASRVPATMTCHALPGPSRAITNRSMQDINDQHVRDFMNLSGSACPTSGLEQYKIYVLQAGMTGSTEAVTAFGLFTLRIDFNIPDPPLNISVGDGETELPVSWTASSATDIAEYRIYHSEDISGDDGSCASATLVPGSTPPASSTYGTISGGASTSYSLRGIGMGERVAVAIAAVDKAGNVGKLSNLACGMAVPTDGFWDRYTAGGGHANTCSVARAAGATGNTDAAYGALGATLIAAAVVKRRRRRDAATGGAR